MFDAMVQIILINVLGYRLLWRDREHNPVRLKQSIVQLDAFQIQFNINHKRTTKIDPTQW